MNCEPPWRARLSARAKRLARAIDLRCVIGSHFRRARERRSEKSIEFACARSAAHSRARARTRRNWKQWPPVRPSVGRAGWLADWLTGGMQMSPSIRATPPSWRAGCIRAAPTGRPRALQPPLFGAPEVGQMLSEARGRPKVGRARSPFGGANLKSISRAAELAKPARANWPLGGPNGRRWQAELAEFGRRPVGRTVNVSCLAGRPADLIMWRRRFRGGGGGASDPPDLRARPRLDSCATRAPRAPNCQAAKPAARQAPDRPTGRRMQNSC